MKIHVKRVWLNVMESMQCTQQKGLGLRTYSPPESQCRWVQTVSFSDAPSCPALHHALCTPSHPSISPKHHCHNHNQLYVCRGTWLRLHACSQDHCSSSTLTTSAMVTHIITFLPLIAFTCSSRLSAVSLSLFCHHSHWVTQWSGLLIQPCPMHQIPSRGIQCTEPKHNQHCHYASSSPLTATICKTLIMPSASGIP